MTKSNPYSFEFLPWDKYHEIFRLFQYEIDLLNHIISSFPKLHETLDQEKIKLLREELAKLSTEEKKQVDEFMRYAKENLKEKDHISGAATMKEKVGKLIEAMITDVKISSKTIPFLMEMSLVYLITVFEEFLKSELIEAAKTNTNILKSTKILTHEEILNCSSLEQIHSLIMEKDFGKLLDYDIEELGKELGDRFKLLLNSNPEWDMFKERFYRRHAIVHNQGIADKKYVEKTSQGVINQELVTNQNYMKDSLRLFGNFAAFIMNFFSQKYPSKEKN